MKKASDAEVGKRAEEARRILQSCSLCPRNCRVDRTRGEKGFCGLTGAARCFREALYYHEESELVPSHMLFLSGCNLRCEFCLVSEWNEAPIEAPDGSAEARERILDRSARAREWALKLSESGRRDSNPHWRRFKRLPLPVGLHSRRRHRTVSASQARQGNLMPSTILFQGSRELTSVVHVAKLDRVWLVEAAGRRLAAVVMTATVATGS